MATIPAEELADVFRKALAGEIPVRLTNPEFTWDGAYAGNAEFWFGDWRIEFFNDCDSLDYTEQAVAPDGRQCDDWCTWQENPDGGGIFCPLDLLSADECAAVEAVLKRAT